MAMALALLGPGADAPVGVDDASSVDTSFPGFTSTLRSLGADVTDARGDMT
jgi:3-phosphoshikimate 1-carboxyvinyltransferase